MTNNLEELFEKDKDYLEEWLDETNNGTLTAEQSDREFKYQLLKQLITMNRSLSIMCAAMLTPLMKEDENE